MKGPRKTSTFKAPKRIKRVVEGVPVIVSVDRVSGRVLSARPGQLRAGTTDRAVVLAMARVMKDTIAKKRVRDGRRANKASRRTRHKNAESHPSALWLRYAVAAHPECGARKLAERARRILALSPGDYTPELSGSITTYRASQFLKNRG